MFAEEASVPCSSTLAAAISCVADGGTSVAAIHHLRIVAAVERTRQNLLTKPARDADRATNTRAIACSAGRRPAVNTSHNLCVARTVKGAW